MTLENNDVIRQIREGDKIGILKYLREGGDPNARNNLGWTLLHLACLEGQAEISGILLDSGATVNCCTTDMCTPLHRAAERGNKTVVEVLVTKGAYINAQDKNGSTPLHEAAKGFHTATVRYLLEKKADKNRMNKKNQIFSDLVGQQLMPTVESGDSEVLVQWLDWGLSPNTFGNLNWSLLHHASARGQINIASILIERGANVNSVDSNRGTPLHAATFNGHKDIVQLLIASGANVNAKDQRGNTPLHSAIAGVHPEIINMLLACGCDMTIENNDGKLFTHLVNDLLISAVEKNQVAQVTSLLKGIADPNAVTANGFNVLCCAAFQGESLIVDALLEAGANPNLNSADTQKSPLHYAAARGHFFIVKALIDKGASVALKDRNCSTPLHEASREGIEDIMTVLIGRGASIDAQDIDGNAPLHIAGRWGQASAIDLLIEKGADTELRNKSGLLYSDLALMRAVRTEDVGQVLSCLAWGGGPNIQDSKGWTLLHHAVYKESLEVCSLLIESEADVNIADKNGRTPLLLAAYTGNHKLMEVLINNGAQIDTQDKEGNTPIHWAADAGSIASVQLLIDSGANQSLKNRNGLTFTDLLLKHLYFAVRHNDESKVECLLRAGADQTAEVRGTCTTPREEAKRRKLYPLLKKMIALHPKKISSSSVNEDQLEDVAKLFEAHVESVDEPFEAPSKEEFDPNENNYWKSNNPFSDFEAGEIFKREQGPIDESWTEKSDVVPLKLVCEEDLQSLKNDLEGKPKLISANEFFKDDDPPWWETVESDNDESDSEESEQGMYIIQTFEEVKKKWGNIVTAKEFFREDECWWRDAVEDLDNPKQIQQIPDTVREKEFLAEICMEQVNSEEDTLQKKWGNVVTAKEFFREDECWWQDTVDDLNNPKQIKQIPDTAIGERNLAAICNEKTNIEDETLKFLPRNENSSEKYLDWDEVSEVLINRAINSKETPKTTGKTNENVKMFICQDALSLEDMDTESSEEESSLYGDLEESFTDDWETANDSIMSDTSTMYSACEGDRILSSEYESFMWENGALRHESDISNSLEDYSEEKSDWSEITEIHFDGKKSEEVNLSLIETIRLSSSDSESSINFGSDNVNKTNDDVFTFADLDNYLESTSLHNNTEQTYDLLKRKTENDATLNYIESLNKVEVSHTTVNNGLNTAVCREIQIKEKIFDSQEQTKVDCKTKENVEFQQKSKLNKHVTEKIEHQEEEKLNSQEEDKLDRQDAEESITHIEDKFISQEEERLEPHGKENIYSQKTNKLNSQEKEKFKNLEMTELGIQEAEKFDFKKVDLNVQVKEKLHSHEIEYLDNKEDKLENQDNEKLDCQGKFDVQEEEKLKHQFEQKLFTGQSNIGNKISSSSQLPKELNCECASNLLVDIENKYLVTLDKKSSNGEKVNGNPKHELKSSLDSDLNLKTEVFLRNFKGMEETVIEQPIPNKMISCLAKVNASLAKLEATMADDYPTDRFVPNLSSFKNNRSLFFQGQTQKKFIPFFSEKQLCKEKLPKLDENEKFQIFKIRVNIPNEEVSNPLKINFLTPPPAIEPCVVAQNDTELHKNQLKLQ